MLTRCNKLFNQLATQNSIWKRFVHTHLAHEATQIDKNYHEDNASYYYKSFQNFFNNVDMYGFPKDKFKKR